MLEYLEHQSLGAAGLAPIAKPARNTKGGDLRSSVERTAKSIF
jgi:hypothetical protein